MIYGNAFRVARACMHASGTKRAARLYLAFISPLSRDTFVSLTVLFAPLYPFSGFFSFAGIARGTPADTIYSLEMGRRITLLFARARAPVRRKIWTRSRSSLFLCFCFFFVRVPFAPSFVVLLAHPCFVRFYPPLFCCFFPFSFFPFQFSFCSFLLSCTARNTCWNGLETAGGFSPWV